MRTPLAVGGTKVKVYVFGSYADRVELAHMALVHGVDDDGKADGDGFPVTFDGNRALTLEARSKTRISDVLDIPVTPGTWYIDDAYASKTFPYAYEVDTGWWRRDGADKPGWEKLKSRTGITRRIDVLTTDRRPLIVCFGDSITHGFGSTPNAGARYPDVLSKLVDQPVLNLGVNADLFSRNAHCYAEIGDIAGVEQVIMLMGINDIILGGGVKSAKEYGDEARHIIEELHRRKIQVVWGTIPPAGGMPQFDKDPAKEEMRQAINTWIREQKLTDAIVDFDKAIADPKAPTRLLDANQSGDHIHPSDAGYKKMGEAAATAIKGLARKK
jgi:lysophospholipase L1-like esterase